MNHSSVIWIIVLILIILVVVAHHGKKNIRESFETTSWGYVPESNAPVINDAERRYIVGPDPNCNQITGWQYNPQNTQVGYHFYNENRDLNYYANGKNNLNVPINVLRSTNRIAPITNGEVGILTTPTYQVIEQDNPQNSTRVPNDYSNINQNIIPNPTTMPEMAGPYMNYDWDWKCSS